MPLATLGAGGAPYGWRPNLECGGRPALPAPGARLTQTFQ
jgi:hypothetical protein